MSIKWGKAEKPKDEIHDDLGGFEEESDESDIDMDEETPDLYRNSALGMGMPRDGDSEDEDEDDEDEEDMMQFGGDDVIDEMMVGLFQVAADGQDEDEDTEPSSEEDDDDMDDDMVHEDDWTDEDEGDEEDGLVEQEVILGPPGDDEEVTWDVSADSSWS
jgi:E3 ubiquitin-protein ligase HUWE1